MSSFARTRNCAPCDRQPNIAGRAIEEAAIERPFQFLYTAAEGRGRKMQILRSRDVAQSLGDSQKRLDIRNLVIDAHIAIIALQSALAQPAPFRDSGTTQCRSEALGRRVQRRLPMRASDRMFDAFWDVQKEFFILPDCWDIFSAVMLQNAGIRAVATSSVSLGFANGLTAATMISMEGMLQKVAQIVSAIDIPLSVDLESGYADTAAGIERNVREVIRTGIVAFNLEDSDGIPGAGLRPAEEHAERIRACRRAAEAEGAPRLFVNGRTDGFWNHDGESLESKADEAIRRGNLYLGAGADGVFVSGNHKLSKDIIARLVKSIRGPVSILLDSADCSLAELKAMGVRRVTLGSLPIRAGAGFCNAASSSWCRIWIHHCFRGRPSPRK
jgi:2-methylisocitrate lyase-like PEP mutase family enzyme